MSDSRTKTKAQGNQKTKNQHNSDPRGQPFCLQKRLQHRWMSVQSRAAGVAAVTTGCRSSSPGKHGVARSVASSYDLIAAKNGGVVATTPTHTPAQLSASGSTHVVAALSARRRSANS